MGAYPLLQLANFLLINNNKMRRRRRRSRSGEKQRDFCLIDQQDVGRDFEEKLRILAIAGAISYLDFVPERFCSTSLASGRHKRPISLYPILKVKRLSWRTNWLQSILHLSSFFSRPKTLDTQSNGVGLIRVNTIIIRSIVMTCRGPSFAWVPSLGSVWWCR